MVGSNRQQWMGGAGVGNDGCQAIQMTAFLSFTSSTKKDNLEMLLGECNQETGTQLCVIAAIWQSYKDGLRAQALISG